MLTACSYNTGPKEAGREASGKIDYANKIGPLSNNEEIVKSIVCDFDKNGEEESFILTRFSISEIESKFNLWFVNQYKAEKIVNNAVALDTSNIITINQGNVTHVLFQQEQMNLCDNCIARIFGVNAGEVKTVFEKSCCHLVCVSNELYIQDQQYCTYDKDVKAWCSKEDVFYDLLWDESIKQYVEPKSIILRKSDFLKYDGAEKVLNQIKKRYKGRVSLLSFIKRENDTIDINLIEKAQDGYRNKWHVPLKTRDEKIISKKLSFKRGNKKRLILGKKNTSTSFISEITNISTKEKETTVYQWKRNMFVKKDCI